MKLFARNHPSIKIPADAITVTVTDGGYQPDTIELPAERRATIVFTRETESPCAAEVRFSDLGVIASLPVGQPVLVDLPPASAGEHTFECAMGMLRGRLIATNDHGSNPDADQAGPRSPEALR